MRWTRMVGSRLVLVGALGPLGALLNSPAEVGAQPTRTDAQARLAAGIEAAVDRLVPEIVEQRHRIHEHPELGNREVETAKLVADHLQALGFDEVRTEISHTGVVGVLRGGKPGPIVAVRADMDALPVTERTDLPFKSTVRTTYLDQEVGVMHACGHDIHTSVELGVAAVLSSLRDELPGTVKFIFQPAEEGPPPGEEGGAELMVADGVLGDPAPEAIFGLHSTPELDVGSVGYTPGPALAAVDHFYIEILGTQSHGAWPHNSVDPVVMAAQAIEALQTIRSRNMPPLEPGVVSIGIVRGGERFNIIPERVHLEGTVRTYDPEVRDPGGRDQRRWRHLRAGLRPRHALHLQRRGLERAHGPDDGEDRGCGERDSHRPDDGGRGLRLLLERDPGVLLLARDDEAGDAVGRPSHADLPR